MGPVPWRGAGSQLQPTAAPLLGDFLELPGLSAPCVQGLVSLSPLYPQGLAQNSALTEMGIMRRANEITNEKTRCKPCWAVVCESVSLCDSWEVPALMAANGSTVTSLCRSVPRDQESISGGSGTSQR